MFIDFHGQIKITNESRYRYHVSKYCRKENAEMFKIKNQKGMKCTMVVESDRRDVYQDDGTGITLGITQDCH